MRAAVPNYVGTDFSEAPPGHRFRLYFQVWRGGSWEIESQKKNEAIGKVLDMGPASDLVQALNRRAAAAGSDPFRIDALSTAPFVTGMGMEHPLENGFAFLDPYGVPYLPGSSVKGVLRRAAEELALFEEEKHGWTLPAVWWLFGLDASSAFFQQDRKKDGEFVDPEPVRAERARWRRAYETATGSADFSPPGNDPAAVLLRAFHALVDPDGKIADDTGQFLHKLQNDSSARNAVHTRGSLAFWDVIPLPGKGDAANLRVDIMNPHYSHYYQNGEPPHDAGSPKPIFYLTVPAGWSFTFRVQLLPTGALPPWFTEPAADGRPRWQTLLEAAFEHAFTWLGFGAKTSLGYGGMTRDPEWRSPEVEEVRLPSPQVIPGAGRRPGRQGARTRDARPAPRHTARRPGSERARQASGSDPLSARIARLRQNDRPGIQALADEIAKIEDEGRRRRLALELRSQVGGSPLGRVVLNNHPVLKRYW